jgi:hypothetical protein
MFGNISNTTVSTFGVILVAAAIVDILIIFIIRYLPSILGNHSYKEINVWYNKFGLSAVIADVLSITIGVIVGQYIYRQVVEPSLGWSLLAFLGIVVAFQVCHDLLFALFVIYPIPQGHNDMIDVFKSYANSGKYGILLVDATMMILTTLLASFLYTQPAALTIVTGSIAVYSLPYILTTRNEFSNTI